MLPMVKILMLPMVKIQMLPIVKIQGKVQLMEMIRIMEMVHPPEKVLVSKNWEMLLLKE